MPTVIETKMNFTHHFSSLIVRQVSRLKQNGLNNRQIADDILIPVSEVEEILEENKEGENEEEKKEEEKQ